MLLVLARFLFGFGMALIAAAILLATTAACLAFIRRTLNAQADQRRQDISNGVAVFIAALLILLGCFLAGHFLYGLLGREALVGGIPHWLTSDGQASLVAMLGAVSALGLMAYFPRRLRREREPDAAPKRVPAATAKRAAEKSGKPAKAAQGEPKPRRMTWLGWTGLFLTLTGGALLVFGYIVTPPELRALLARNLDTLAGHQAETIAHARFIFYVAGATLLAGALLLLAWPLVHRPAHIRRRSG